MFKYFHALLEILKSYHFYFIPVMLYEVYFNIKFSTKFNKFNYLKNNFSTDPIPCSYFFISYINKFFNQNKINSICDLGSGYGKLVFYFGKILKKKIDGVELNIKIFKDTMFLQDQNIQIYNEDILTFDISKKNYEALIINDPLQRQKDFITLLAKLKNLDKKIFIIFININKIKQIEVLKTMSLIKRLDISNTRGVIICSKN